MRSPRTETKSGPRSSQLKKARAQQRPNAAKTKINKFIKQTKKHTQPQFFLLFLTTPAYQTQLYLILLPESSSDYSKFIFLRDLYYSL